MTGYQSGHHRGGVSLAAVVGADADALDVPGPQRPATVQEPRA